MARPRKFARLLWVLLGCLLLPVFAWLAWWGVSLRQLDRAKADLVAAGFPATPAEVIPPEIPDADNAAPLLAGAEASWKKAKGAAGFIDASPGASDPARDPALFDEAKLEKLRAQFASPDVRETFRLMDGASRKPAARFERDYAKGPAIELAPITFLPEASRHLGSDAWIAARDGDQRAAAEEIATVSRLAGFGLRDELMIGWLVGISLDQLSVRSAQEAISVLPPGSFRMQDWEALDGLWAAHLEVARASLARTLEAERVLFGCWVYEGAMAGRISLGDVVVQTVPVSDAEQAAKWRRTMSMYQIALAPLVVGDYAAYLKLMRSVRDAVKNREIPKPEEKNFSSKVPRYHILARLSAPVYDGIPQRVAEYETILQLGRLGLALEKFRAAHGSYPASLDELGLPAEAITDPFAGKPLVYKPDGNSVLVYSLGANRADDGGSTEQRRDLAWRVKRD